VCHDAARCNAVGATFASALNKAAYWLGAVSLLSEIVGQLMAPVLRGDEAPALRPAITDEGIKCGLDFFSLRYLFGVATLDVEIAQQSWLRRRAPCKHAVDCRRLAARLLAQCPANCITEEAASRCGPPFRDLASTKQELRPAAVEQLEAAFRYLASVGVGQVVQAEESQRSICFRKFHCTVLHHAARSFLREHNLPMLAFASEWLPAHKSGNPAASCEAAAPPAETAQANSQTANPPATRGGRAAGGGRRRS